ncbi:hypothetical protein FA95DRAFT_327295 [Auriscalpium vulgare]|uniref:Uncharacterized protein n=1 Tax=Auriscalpium vulgare TaxID=40419 RepID=A0ACB8RIU8_9AGAM|nr:hypothetical protein FA95DRAFT_327295 [Auriscalpium vulgare]
MDSRSISPRRSRRLSGPSFPRSPVGFNDCHPVSPYLHPPELRSASLPELFLSCLAHMLMLFPCGSAQIQRLNSSGPPIYYFNAHTDVSAGLGARLRLLIRWMQNAVWTAVHRHLHAGPARQLYPAKNTRHGGCTGAVYNGGQDEPATPSTPCFSAPPPPQLCPHPRRAASSRRKLTGAPWRHLPSPKLKYVHVRAQRRTPVLTSCPSLSQFEDLLYPPDHADEPFPDCPAYVFPTLDKIPRSRRHRKSARRESLSTRMARRLTETFRQPPPSTKPLTSERSDSLPDNALLFICP